MYYAYVLCTHACTQFQYYFYTTTYVQVIVTENENSVKAQLLSEHQGFFQRSKDYYTANLKISLNINKHM